MKVKKLLSSLVSDNIPGMKWVKEQLIKGKINITEFNIIVLFLLLLLTLVHPIFTISSFLFGGYCFGKMVVYHNCKTKEVELKILELKRDIDINTEIQKGVDAMINEIIKSMKDNTKDNNPKNASNPNENLNK